MRLNHRLAKLEHDRGLRGPCPLCRGKGLVGIQYDGDPLPPACAGCGKRLLIHVCYVKAPREGSPCG